MIVSARRRRRGQSVIHAATALAVAAALALAAGCGSDAGPQTLRYEIEDVSKASKQRAGKPAGIPGTIEARVGDRIVVTNHDDVLHIVAGHPVAAGKTVTIPLEKAGRFQTVCSARKDQSVTLVVHDP